MRPESHSRPLRRANLLAFLLLLVGTFQMAGFLINSKALRGIGAVSMVSPFPKVFCSAPVHGEPGVALETFASEFVLQYDTQDGAARLAITPEVYSRLRGPYNRRNVYGAALAFGPCLPPELADAVLRYALVEPGTLCAELGLPEDADNFRVKIRGEANGIERHWEMHAKQ